MTITADMPFKSPPRISKARFAQIVRERANPGVAAERDPGAYWQVAVDAGLDPLLLRLWQQTFVLVYFTFCKVQGVMFRCRHQLEILKAIIILHSIDVMNMLIARERPPNVFLHNQAVLHNRASINGLHQVAGCVAAYTTFPLRMVGTTNGRLRRVLAFARAEARRLMPKTIFVHLEYRGTYLTHHWDLWLSKPLTCLLRSSRKVHGLTRSILWVIPQFLHVRPAWHRSPLMVKHPRTYAYFTT